MIVYTAVNKYMLIIYSNELFSFCTWQIEKNNEDKHS